MLHYKARAEVARNKRSNCSEISMNKFVLCLNESDSDLTPSVGREHNSAEQNE